jgi:hypothetical protein
VPGQGSTPPTLTTLASAGVPPKGRPACDLHAFVPGAPGLARCTRCEGDYSLAFAAGYRAGVRDGRADAWAHPNGRRLRPRAVRTAAVMALALALLGAAATAPPLATSPPDVVEALRHSAEASEALEADLEAAWGRRCPDDACRAEARAEAAWNRARVRAAASALAAAAASLDDAEHDARACAASGTAPCADYTPAAAGSSRAATLAAARTLRDETSYVRLSPLPLDDRARP